MVTVTAEDLRRVENLEHELADAGREPDRVALQKALTLLRRAAIERFERTVSADTLPLGVLPAESDPPLRVLSQEAASRLSSLQEVGQRRRLSAEERRELQSLLDQAEAGAMQNVLALVRDRAPDSDAYLRALRAYRRSFARSGSKTSKRKRFPSPTRDR